MIKWRVSSFQWTICVGLIQWQESLKWGRQEVRGFPGGNSGKQRACQCNRLKRQGFDSWVGKIPWRRAQQLTPVFLPGESHGQRSLLSYIQSIALQSQTRLQWLSIHARRKSEGGKVMIEAGMGVMCFEDGGRGQSPWKLKKQGNRFSSQSLWKEPAFLTPWLYSPVKLDWFLTSDLNL